VRVQQRVAEELQSLVVLNTEPVKAMYSPRAERSSGDRGNVRQGAIQ